MNTEEVQSRLDALVPLMLAKGFRQPSAVLIVKSQENMACGGSWKDPNRPYGEGFHYANKPTAEEAFAAFELWVSEQPDAKQRKLTDFMAAVAKAIDLGKETGIEADFVNPLSVLMKTLSENALTYQRAAAE